MDSQKVLVLGTGKSGICAAKQIVQRGGQVVLFASNEKLDTVKVMKNFRKRDT